MVRYKYNSLSNQKTTLVQPASMDPPNCPPPPPPPPPHKKKKKNLDPLELRYV